MQKRKKTWYLAQGLLSCINLHQKNRWLPAHPPLTVWSLHKPQTTLSQRKCAEVYFSQELTLAAKQEHQVVLFLFPYPHWCFVLHLCNFDECFADEKKRLWNLCCLIKKKKSAEQERMWPHFYLGSISPDEYVVNVAETTTKQVTMSQEILLNSVISFSESSFSVWSQRKKIAFNIHLNWEAAECGGWYPINSWSVTSFLFSLLPHCHQFRIE